MMSTVPRCLQICRYHPLNVIKRYAGHSKWQNIRHTKAAKDSERALLIQQFVQRMRIAIQEGGSSDPNKNVQLRQAIEQARRNNMPAATIENQLKTAKENKENSKSAWLEVRGVKGSCLLISVMAPQPIKVKYAVATILKKHRAEFADNTVKRMFDNKGVIMAQSPTQGPSALDDAISHAIEAGAEEVEWSEANSETLKFICEMNDMDKVRTKLASLNYTIVSYEVSFVPKVVSRMTDSDLELMHKLIGKIEDLPEVVQVYDNIVWSTET